MSRLSKRRKKPIEETNMPETEQSAAEVRTEAIAPEETETQAAEATEEETREKELGDEAAKAAEALKAALAKQEEYLTMAQRVQADFENFRRRNQSVRKEAFDDGARAFATTLLPVLDNLERAIGAADEAADKSLLEGVEMVYRLMCDAFQKRGVTVIDRMGEPFDPNLENAVMQGEPEDGKPGTVCAVLQKGYIMEGTVLRHAMVKVVPE